VKVRLGEKQTLDNYLTFFATRAERVQNLEYYAESRLKSLGLLDDSAVPVHRLSSLFILFVVVSLTFVIGHLADSSLITFHRGE
jgi:hypothetical protein